VRNGSLLEALVYNVLVSAHYVEMAMSCIDIMSVGKCHAAAGVEAKGDDRIAVTIMAQPLCDRITYIINLGRRQLTLRFGQYLAAT